MPGPHPGRGFAGRGRAARWRNALPGTLTSGNAVRPPVDALPGRAADEDADDQHDHARDDHRGHSGQPRKRPFTLLTQGRSRPGCRRAHRRPPVGRPVFRGYARVATRIALIVCRRFSAWSNTILAGELNTSPVTSRPEVMPVCSMISRPTMVFGSWNAGRQCMNLTAWFPVASIRAALTW